MWKDVQYNLCLDDDDGDNKGVDGGDDGDDVGIFRILFDTSPIGPPNDE